MAEVDSITRLAQELDETRVRAFIRREMWNFLLDIGWTNDLEPPALSARARRENETAAEAGAPAPTSKTHAAQLAELRARFSPRSTLAEKETEDE